MIWQSRTSERNLDNLPEENACEEADECVHNAIGMTQKQTSLHLFVKDLRSSLQGILWFDIKETLRNWIDGNGCWLSRVDPILLSPTESYWVLLSPTESYCTTHHTHGTLHASTASTLQFHIAGPSPFSVLCLVDSKSTCLTSTNTLAASFPAENIL